ncbi:MAG: hypothetical protein ACNI25_15950 [Halarcobacter sp.]
MKTISFLICILFSHYILNADSSFNKKNLTIEDKMKIIKIRNKSYNNDIGATKSIYLKGNEIKDLIEVANKKNKKVVLSLGKEELANKQIVNIYITSNQTLKSKKSINLIEINNTSSLKKLNTNINFNKLDVFGRNFRLLQLNKNINLRDSSVDVTIEHLNVK